MPTVSKFISGFAKKKKSSGSSQSTNKSKKSTSSQSNSSKSNTKSSSKKGTNVFNSKSNNSTKKSALKVNPNVSKFISGFSNKKKVKSKFSNKSVGTQNAKSTGNFNNGVQSNSQKLKIIKDLGLKVNPAFTKGATTGTLKFTDAPLKKSNQPNKSKLAFFLQPGFSTTSFEAKQSAEKNPILGNRPKPSPFFSSSSKGAPSIFDTPAVAKALGLGGKKKNNAPNIPPPGVGSNGKPGSVFTPNTPPPSLGDTINNFFGGGGSSGNAGQAAPAGSLSFDFNPVTVTDAPLGDGDGGQPPLIDSSDGLFGGGASDDVNSNDGDGGGFFSSITKDPILFGVGAVAVIALLGGLLKKR